MGEHPGGLAHYACSGFGIAGVELRDSTQSRHLGSRPLGRRQTVQATGT
jgi:hypothetical protein